MSVRTCAVQPRWFVDQYPQYFWMGTFGLKTTTNVSSECQTLKIKCWKPSRRKRIIWPISADFAQYSGIVKGLPPKSVRSRASMLRRGSTTQRSPTCYNCRGSGYISWDSSRPQRPMKCYDFGSNQYCRKDCPEQESGSTQQDASSESVESTIRYTNKHFTKTILMNGTLVYGLLDTGSTSVLVHESVTRSAEFVYRHSSC